MVLYYSGMMYKYYSCLGFSPIKLKKEVEDIHNEVFNNIPHFIKNNLHVDCHQDDFFMYRNKVIVWKIEFIPPIIDSKIPIYLCKKNLSLISQLMTCHPSLSYFQRKKLIIYILVLFVAIMATWIQFPLAWVHGRYISAGTTYRDRKSVV